MQVELESMPISIQLLADSGIVPVLKSMRPQSSNASRIVDSWKAHHRALKVSCSPSSNELVLGLKNSFPNPNPLLF